MFGGIASYVTSLFRDSCDHVTLLTVTGRDGS